MTFEELVHFLAVVLKGTPRQRMEYCFKLFGMFLLQNTASFKHLHSFALLLDLNKYHELLLLS
jgi:hypothetical protein